MKVRGRPSLKVSAPVLAKLLGPLMDGSRLTATDLGFSEYHMKTHFLPRGIVARVKVKVNKGRGAPNLYYEITNKGRGQFNLVKKHYQLPEAPRVALTDEEMTEQMAAVA